MISLALALRKLPLPSNPNATHVVNISGFYYQDHGGIHFCTFLEKIKKKEKNQNIAIPCCAGSCP